ncbi:unnamed protein product, partial [marine sediment metagenome]
MRMVTFIRNGVERIGIFTEEDLVIDLTEGHSLVLLSEGNNLERAEEISQKTFMDMKSFLSKSETLIPLAKTIVSYVKETKRATYSLNEVKLITPIPNPGKIIVMGSAYRTTENLATHGLKPLTALVGPDDPIIISKNHKQVAYENELGVVIGKRCKNLSMEDEDWSYIGGYTIYNDVTDIGFQRDAYELDEEGEVKRNEKD